MDGQRLTKCNLKIYGRAKELKIIRDAFLRAKSSNNDEQHSQIVLVSGSSGTGKSRLIFSAFKNATCLYGSGKFEKIRSSKPYSALLNCISELCCAMIPHRELYAERLKESGLDDQDLSFLADFVPEVLENVNNGGGICSNNNESKTISYSKESLQKLKYILRLFLRAISTAERPTVLVLDDLQWIDEPTFDILQSLLSDSQQQHLLFVGSFRDNEVGQDHMLTGWVDGLKDATPLPITVPIGNLDVDYIHNALVDILRVDEAMELAKLLHTRTDGNILHVLQLIDLMQAEKCLSYSLTSYSWTWDMVKIREKTSLSDNVVDVVRAKMNILLPEEQSCLKQCAGLGFRFESSVLALLQNAHAEENISVSELSVVLNKLVENGFVERLGDATRLKFTHDKIHQAALSLISTEKLPRFHLSIGFALWKRVESFSTGEFDKITDRLLFLTADQLNLGRHVIMDDEHLSYNLARLNLAVADRAACFSAFGPAAEYAEVALGLLHNMEHAGKIWSTHRALALELYSLLAEMSFCSGNFERLRETVDIVLKHTKTIEDRIRVYHVFIAYLESEAKYDQFVHTLLDVSGQLGQTLKEHPSRLQLKWVTRKTKRRLASMSDDAIMNLPSATSKNKTDAIQLLSSLFVPALQIGRHRLNATSLCLIMELSLDHGLAPYSAAGFSTLGLYFVATDVDLAYRLAKSTSLLLDERPECLHSRSRTLLFSSYVRHWREPLAKLVDSCFEGYRIGMKSGDLTYAFHCLNGYSAMYFYSGLPLGPLVHDMKRFCTQAEEYGQKYTLIQILPVTQCILNATNPSSTRSSIVNLSQGLAKYYRDKHQWDGSTGKETEHSYTMQITFYCGDLDLAASEYSLLKDLDPGAFRGVFFHQARVFFFALIAMSKYRTTKTRTWKQEALQHYKVVRDWVKKDRAINLVHKLMILKAHKTVTMEKKFNTEQAQIAFDKAIAASSKSGFPQDAALAALLASQCLTGEEHQHSYVLQACRFFSTWGAAGIANCLMDSESRRSSSVVNVDSGRGGFRSRERYDESIVKEHRHLDLSEQNEVVQ